MSRESMTTMRTATMRTKAKSPGDEMADIGPAVVASRAVVLDSSLPFKRSFVEVTKSSSR
jgi:hypothetical protein